MSTKTETSTAAGPELSIITRVASIPLVASSLDTIHTTLTNNAYTRATYSTAQELSKTALSYTEPIQKRLAPILVRADGYANKGLDVVESKYPYPFKTPTEDIVKDIKGRSDHAYEVANKTIDEKVKSPAYSVAHGIDQSFTPIINCFEAAVHKIHPEAASTSESVTDPDHPKYQYQRAFELSKDLSGQLYTYSTEQVNQIKAQSVLVQSATATAQSISAVASTSYIAAQEKIHLLSDRMLSELQRIQVSTTALPSSLQLSFHDITTNLSSTISDLSVILTSKEPLSEKVNKLRSTVQQRVQPLLDAAATRVHDIMSTTVNRAPIPDQGTTNGNAT